MSRSTYKIQHLGKGSMHYIVLDDKTSSQFVGKTKRILCIINHIELHCALKYSKQIGYYVMLSKDTLKRINATLNDRVIAHFEMDSSPIQFEESEALNEVINTDQEAKKIWEALTPGNQRSIIYWIKKNKNIDKQIERSLMVAHQLKLGIKSSREIIKK